MTRQHGPDALDLHAVPPSVLAAASKPLRDQVGPQLVGHPGLRGGEVLVDLVGRGHAHDHDRHRRLREHEAQRRRPQGDVVTTADLLDLERPVEQRTGRGRVVVPGALGGPGQDAAVEHAGGQVRDPPLGALSEHRRGGLVQQRVPAGDQHAVEVAPLEEGRRRLHRVRAQRDRVDDPLIAQVDERAVGARHRFVDVVVGIVDVDDVDPIGTQTPEAAVDRLLHGVIAEVEPGLDLTVGTGVQQAADLRRDHDTVTSAAHGGTETALGLAQPVERRRVEERHPRVECPPRRLAGRRLVIAPEDRGQGGGAQPQPAHSEGRSPQDDLLHRPVRHTLPLGRRDK